MRFLAAAWLVAASVFGSIQGALAAEAGGSYDAWLQHRDAIVREPGLLRYYTFESIDKNVVANRAAQGSPLGFRPVKGAAAQPEVIAGRWPAKKALRFDQGALEGDAFSIRQAFTLSAWVRLNGQGVMRGNSGTTNGTIFGSGSGYTDGWRLTINYPQRTLDFSIGRPSPKHSKSMRTLPLAPATWQHLAVTWDGRQMRVYVDGLLAGSGVFDEAYTPAKTWHIGYRGFGVGSVMMDIDEVAVYDRALSAVDIVRQAHFHIPLPAEVAQQIAAAEGLTANKDFAGAAAVWGTLADRKDLAVDYRAVALLEWSRSLVAQKRGAQAAAVVARVVQLPGLAEGHRRNAEMSLLQLLPQAAVASLPAEVYQRLLALEGLTSSERIAISVSLARRWREAGNWAAARQQYEKMLQDATLSPQQQADLRLELGHTCVEAREFAAARREYETVLQANDLPAWYKTNSLFCLAESYQRQGDRASARQRLAKVASVAGAPPHHVWEAQQRTAELDRLDAGQPARDPGQSRGKTPQGPKPGVEFFVAPDGRDENPGTLAQPFATLCRARDAVRGLKRNGPLPAGGVTVWLRGGEYRTNETFALTKEDSGTADAPVVYAAYQGENVRLTGGVRVRGFQPVTDRAILARLPEESRGKVFQVDLRAQGVADLGTFKPGGYASGAGFGTRPILQLYFNGKTMQIARWPNQGFVEVGELLDSASAFDHRGIHGTKAGVFTYCYDRPQRWLGEKDMWLYGYWFHDWADSYEKVASIDVDKRAITLAPPSHRYGFRQRQRYYAINLLAEIDEPGEWYLDRSSGVLYFYPPSDSDQAVVEVSVMESPLVQLNEVSHLRFRGLIWELGRGNGLAIKGGSDCALAGCTVRKFSGDAVMISGQHHAVLGCDCSELGRGAISIQGGDRKTLAPGAHVVENCYFHHLSRIDHTYTPAVLVNGVGARVAHNLISHSNSSAMRVEGNDNLVEFNEVHDVLEESDDQGGVDMFGNPGYRGNIYRYNYWHHIGNGLGCGQAGIRLDDAISGTLIYGNVFYRCSDGNFGGVQIHGGKDNIVDNNVFLDCRSAISFSPWPENRWKEYLDRPEIYKLLHKDVDITKPPYSVRYPELAGLCDHINVNCVWRNLALDCGQFLARDRGIQWSMDNHVIGADLSARPNRERYPLPTNSPLLQRVGLRPIPFDEIGLYQDSLRASWPVQEER